MIMVKRIEIVILLVTSIFDNLGGGVEGNALYCASAHFFPFVYTYFPDPEVSVEKNETNHLLGF